MRADRTASAFAVTALTALLLAAADAGAVPLQFTVQGRLTDANGVNRDGAFSIAVRLWSAASGGTLLYKETRAAVPVVNGNFQILVGGAPDADSPKPSLGEVFTGEVVYLEFQAAGETPMVPRQPLLSVPYALRADSAASLAVTAAGALRVADGSQGDGKVLTSDAAGVGRWGTPQAQRHYASVTLGADSFGNPHDFVIAPAAFDPPLAGGLVSVATVEVYVVEARFDTPGGSTSIGGYRSSPGSPFNGTNPRPGVYKNVRLNDAIRLVSIANSNGGGSGTVSWLLVAMP